MDSDQSLATVLDFYRQPAPITDPGKYAPEFQALPDSIDALARVVQGLVLHEFAASAYGVTLPEERKHESHIRRVEQMVDRILELCDQPLASPRPPENRLVGVCRHFVVLYTAMARAKGIPARLRRGFGSYFNRGYYEDHVVSECWDTRANKWVRVDPQLDSVWQKMLKFDFDPLDVPRDRFFTPADAWRLCRSGEADAAKFGIIRGNLRGLWFIAANLVGEVAALNKVEMLQWDIWGGMPQPNAGFNDEQLAFFDRLAELTAPPDTSFDPLRQLYQRDERVRVPAAVFNAITNAVEPVVGVNPSESITFQKARASSPSASNSSD